MPDTSLPLDITRQFSCLPERIFQAWTDPPTMKQWLFKSATNRIVEANAELRPHGRISVREATGNGTIDHYGEILELRTGRRLGFSLHVPQHFPGTSYIVLDLEPAAEGCRMHFRQFGVEPTLVRPDWEKMFDRLQSVLAN